MKRIVALHPDGLQITLTDVPDRKTMERLVGGNVEYVTVLDRIEAGRPIYSWLVINADGRSRHLPRNQDATVIYQRNARWQYPEETNPFQAMREAQRPYWERIGARIIDMTEPEDESDPYIAGPAIYFQGYTIEEIDRLMNEDETSN